MNTNLVSQHKVSFSDRKLVIHSDEWKPTTKFSDQDFLRFVEPETGVHTQILSCTEIDKDEAQDCVYIIL